MRALTRSKVESNLILRLKYKANAIARVLTSTKCSVVNVSGSRRVLTRTVRGQTRSNRSVLCLLRSVRSFRLCNAIHTIVDIYSDVGCLASRRSLRCLFTLMGGCLSPNKLFVFSVGAIRGCQSIVNSAAVTRSERSKDFV